MKCEAVHVSQDDLEQRGRGGHDLKDQLLLLLEHGFTWIHACGLQTLMMNS